MAEIDEAKDRHRRAVSAIKEVRDYLDSREMRELFDAPSSMEGWNQKREGLRSEVNWMLKKLNALFEGPLY